MKYWFWVTVIQPSPISPTFLLLHKLEEVDGVIYRPLIG